MRHRRQGHLCSSDLCPQLVVIAHSNAEGKPDLASADVRRKTVSVLRNTVFVATIAPAVTVAAPDEGGVYLYKLAVTSGVACTDDGAGAQSYEQHMSSLPPLLPPRDSPYITHRLRAAMLGTERALAACAERLSGNHQASSKI